MVKFLGTFMPFFHEILLYLKSPSLMDGTKSIFVSAVTRTLIGGFTFVYSCFAQQISFQIDQFEFDLKRNSSGRS